MSRRLTVDTAPDALLAGAKPGTVGRPNDGVLDPSGTAG